MMHPFAQPIIDYLSESFKIDQKEVYIQNVTDQTWFFTTMGYDRAILLSIRSDSVEIKISGFMHRQAPAYVHYEDPDFLSILYGKCCDSLRLFELEATFSKGVE